MADKAKDSYVFDKVQADQLNKYIRSFMKKLTSKVFRTYNASHLMQYELRKVVEHILKINGTDKLQQSKYLYDLANLKVAKLCNHQKLLSTTATTKADKIDEKLKELKAKLRATKHKKSKNVESLRKKIKIIKDKKKLQSEGKFLSTSTSKINYIDPRITVWFVKKLGLFDKISMFFNTSQQNQFKWAMDVDENFKF